MRLSLEGGWGPVMGRSSEKKNGVGILSLGESRRYAILLIPYVKSVLGLIYWFWLCLRLFANNSKNFPKLFSQFFSQGLTVSLYYIDSGIRSPHL